MHWRSIGVGKEISVGVEFTNLTEEELCDLMCGEPEEELEIMYECFHCGNQSVIWDSDFNFEDFGYDGEGIVHCCHCTKCGARITYEIPVEDEDDADSEG